jgi:uncharacterized protein (DUF779 family)
MLVTVTDAAREAVRTVQRTGRTNLVIVLSNGCCDATAPYLYADHVPPADAEQVAEIDGVAVLAPGWITALYGAGDGLAVDAIHQPPDDSFSLETDHGVRLVLRAPGNEGRG